MMKPIVVRFGALALLASSLLLVSCNSRTPRGDADNVPGPNSPLPATAHAIAGETWPVSRGDAQATGAAKGDLPEKLDRLWRSARPRGNSRRPP